MSRRLLIKTCILLAVTTHASTQYIDFIQNFNSFLQPFTTSKPRNDATKRPDSKHRQTNKLKYQDIIIFDTDDVPRDKPKTVDPFIFYTTTAKPKRKNKTTPSQNHTQSPELNKQKPVNSNKIVNNNRNVNREASIKSNDNRELLNIVDDRVMSDARRIQNYGFDNSFNIGIANKPTNIYGIDNNYNNDRQTTRRTTTDYYNNVRQTTRRTTTDYYNNVRQTTRKTSEHYDFATRKPIVYYNNARQTTKNYNNERTTRWETFTTLNPLLNRPGVRPAIVDESRPPITNRPVTSKPSFDRPFDVATYRPANTRPYETERPTSSGVIRPVTGVNRPEMSDDETGVAIETGPDEDQMSESEKRRLYDICEQKCDEYKSARVKKVVALPLAQNSQGVVLNVSSCAPTNIPLIIGGEVARIQQFPHMALVGWKNLQKGGYSWKCGGSLVSAQFVVTAGHCTFFDKDNNVLSGPPQAVQLGSAIYNDRTATIMQISTIIRHPKYKLRRSYYDVALIKLATSVSFSDKISPACLGVPPAVGKPVIATGWGKTEFGGDSSIELRSVSINIWDMTECREIWDTSLKLPNGPDPDSQICAGDKNGGKDTCQGDSGGPAQVQDGCMWRVVAVTSLGRSCGAPGTPALYAKIPRAFIASQIFTNVKSGRDGNNQYGNEGANGNNWNTGSNNGQNGNNGGFGNGRDDNDPFGNPGVANKRPIQNNNGQSYDNSGRGQNNNGQSYNNNGQSYNNNGQSYNNNGQSYNNNGQSYNNNGQSYNNNGQSYNNNNNGQSYNNGRGQNNNGEYYSDSPSSGNVNNKWDNNANIFGNNKNTRDNNDWSVHTDTISNSRYDKDNKYVYDQSGYDNKQNYRTTTTTVGYNYNYGHNNNNANNYGQNGYNDEQSPTDGFMTQNVFNNGNANNNGYSNYPVVNRPWWT